METTVSSGQSVTTAQIAAALGRSATAVRRALAAIAPAAQKIIAGNLAAVWDFSALPAAMQKDLEARAASAGYRDALHLLSDPDALWQPTLPLAKCSQAVIDKAVKSREFLKPFLSRAETEDRPAAQLEADAIAAHGRVFGHPCSPKSFRRLMARALERDRGMTNWDRLEIHLDEKPGRRTTPERQRRQPAFDHRPLADAIASLQNSAKPTLADRAFLFDATFRHFETLIIQSPDCSAVIKRSLIDYLSSAVPLSKSTKSKSLRLTFAAKYRQWMDGGRCPAALEDRRPQASGNFLNQDFSADLKKIRDTAILHGGNESLAYRKLRQAGELSEAFVNHYSFNPRRDKSRVPEKIRDAITPQVEMCGPIHRGPWEAKMRGPYIQRDWSAVRPGDFFNADDVTWNSYFCFRDDAGQLQITRGECLLFIDTRTGYPLDFMLIAGKYNGLHIRRSFLRVHDLHGLPHIGNYFEKSVWKSRLVVGETGRNLVQWRDAERGLRDYGLDLQVRHATTPRAKPIEGLLRILQERQRNELGFVGFNERLEKMERVQEIIGRCKRGTEDPRNHFLSMEQWSQRISQVLGEYLHEPQNGKMLDGMSPAEMWETRQPLRKLPDEARYILATHRVRVTVRQEGIILKIRGKRLAFYNEETGKRIGCDVFAYYNIEQPDLLTVSDLNRQNFFTVKHHTLPAMSATREQFTAVNADRSGHMRQAKEIYGSIPHPERNFIVRDNAVDENAKELGRFHNAENVRNRQEESSAGDTRRSRHNRALELLRQSYQQTGQHP